MNMPTTIDSLIWVAGSGVLSVLLFMVMFFLRRLVSELDGIREAMVYGFKETNSTLKTIEKDLDDRVHKCEERLAVIEKAGCEVGAQILKNIRG